MLVLCEGSGSLKCSVLSIDSRYLDLISHSKDLGRPEIEPGNFELRFKNTSDSTTSQPLYLIYHSFPGITGFKHTY